MSTNMDSAGPAEDVDMDYFADDTSLPYAPPAHLAERFYRKSNNRRKTSAHSSRRNSLSSRHSHQSALSAHGGPCSTHIAQHLRRASILESRKARLADRAAHAERVRLRAALAKATPRQSYREERAQAAQATRDRLLAEVAAKCEEEVRRVKKVAEETKEKKAAEQARLKAEMAEKFADAARRKLAYQQSLRRPRASSSILADGSKLPRAEPTDLSESTAAETIQRSWRSRQRIKGIADFKGLGLTTDKIAKMGFEEVGSLLSDEKVLDATQHALQALKLLEAGADKAGDRGSVRILLSIYLVLGHPTQTLSFGGKDPQEQDLIEKASDLYRALHTSFEVASDGDIFGAHERLSFSFSTYCSTFHAWKSRDSSSLISIMVKQFVELDLILQTTKDDTAGGASEEYAQAIQTNQIQLLARLKKLAGAETALSMVRKAVRAARKQHRKERDHSQLHVPRSTPSPSPSLDLVETSPSVSRPPAPSRHGSSGAINFAHTMTVLPPNREISHEIQVNGTFQVEQQPWTDSRAQFIDSLQANMRRSMASEGDAAAAGWTYAMAAFIRERLLLLVTKQHPIYDRLDGFLDLKLTRQTAAAGMFSYSDFFETIGMMISQLCSPGRDEIVKEFMADTENDTITRLFKLINIIDLMRLDHINFQFIMASQSIAEHGWEHESNIFQQDLDAGVHNLDNLHSWWASSRSGIAGAVISGTLSPVVGDATYARGLVDLVLSNTPPTYSTLAETLRLDYRRFLSVRATVFKIVSISSILLTTKIRLKRSRQEPWTADADRLLSLLDTRPPTATPDRILAALESGRRIPDALRDGLLNFVSRILPAVLAAISASTHAETEHRHAVQEGKPYDPSLPSRASPPNPSSASQPVFSEQISVFLLKSVREHVFARLAASSSADKARVTAGAGAQLTQMGMGEGAAGVAQVVNILERVRKVDLRGHGKWYEEIGGRV